MVPISFETDATLICFFEIFRCDSSLVLMQMHLTPLLCCEGGVENPYHRHFRTGIKKSSATNKKWNLAQHSKGGKKLNKNNNIAPCWV
jgi:hypothetical protein